MLSDLNRYNYLSIADRLDKDAGKALTAPGKSKPQAANKEKWSSSGQARISAI